MLSSTACARRRVKALSSHWISYATCLQVQVRCAVELSVSLCESKWTKVQLPHAVLLCQQLQLDLN